MRLPPGCNQRLDVRRRACHHIRLAEIAVVGQQHFRPAKLFRQSIDLLQHVARIDLHGEVMAKAVVEHDILGPVHQGRHGLRSGLAV